MTWILQRLALLRAFLDRLTPRERAGVACTAAALSMVLAVGAIDWSMNARAVAQDTAERLALAEGAFEREGNRGYQEGVRAAVTAVETASLVEASYGVAQARAVGALRALADDAGLTNVVIAVDPNESAQIAAGAVGPLVVTLGADFSWPEFLALLRGLRASELAFRPEAIDVRATEGGAQTFVMTFQTPYLHQAPQP